MINISAYKPGDTLYLLKHNELKTYLVTDCGTEDKYVVDMDTFKGVFTVTGNVYLEGVPLLKISNEDTFMGDLKTGDDIAILIGDGTLHKGIAVHCLEDIETSPPWAVITEGPLKGTSYDEESEGIEIFVTVGDKDD